MADDAFGGGGAEKDPDVVGKVDELDERCLPLPIKMFSTVKLETDLFGGFFLLVELDSDLESSSEGEVQLMILLLELLATVDSSLLDENL